MNNISENAENGGAWRLLTLKNRVDSSELNDLAAELGGLNASGHLKLALDLKTNRFISFQAIRYICGLAENLAGRGGEFTLVACPEKTKRHFEIYGSLEHIRIVRSENDLAGGYKRVTRSAPDSVQELP